MEKTHELVCKECRKPFVATAKWRNYAGHWCHDCRRTYMRPRIAAYRKSLRGRAYTKAYAKRNPELIAAGAARRRAKRRSFYQTLKAVPCADCNIQYASHVMQFDHVLPGKTACVGTIKGGSLVRLKDEIAKCEVVCANCHAERTYKRADEKRNNAIARISVTRRSTGSVQRPSAL